MSSCLRVPHAATSASLVRHRLALDLAASVPGEVLDAAALIVSELIGNAVRHGRALPDGGLLARWEVVEAGVRLEVLDGGAGPVGPRPAPASADAESGRGLELVEALAARWGSAPTRGGTAVWAELTGDPGPGADRAGPLRLPDAAPLPGPRPRVLHGSHVISLP